MPAKTLDSGRRELIDRLMNPAAPAWLLTADDEGPALLTALDDDVARDYLAAGCGTVDGAWRVFDLLNSVDRGTTTPAREAVLALASYALNMPELGAFYLAQVQDVDPQHPMVELILTELDRNAGAHFFRSAARALGARIEAA
jgi:hypothetical protein